MESNMIFRNIKIPRLRQNNFYRNPNAEEKSFMPNNALDKSTDYINRITNEFRFLDDRVLQTPPEPSWLPYPITEFADRTEARGRLSKSERDVAVKNCENLADGSKNNLLHRIDYVGSLEQYFIVIIIGIEISAAFGLLVYGIIRFGKIYEFPNVFVDFDFLAKNLSSLPIENVSSVRSASSCIVPAIIQMFSGFAVLSTILCGFNLSLQIIHIVFSSICIPFWFDAIFANSYELNLRYVQLTEDNIRISLYIILLVLLSFTVLIFPTISVVCSVHIILKKFYHLSVRNDSKNATIFLSFCTVVIAAVVIGITIACLINTSKNFYHSHKVDSSMILYGLKEFTISLYILIVSFADFVIALTTERKFHIVSVLIYSICLLILLIHLVTGYRLFAVAQNYRILRILNETDAPFSASIFMILNSFVVILTIAIIANIVANIFASSKRRKLSKIWSLYQPNNSSQRTHL